MHDRLDLNLDRAGKAPLADQIRNGIATAISTGVLQPGARLPSWQDLAAQLGVARGTVRSAYEKLAAGQLIEASRAAGTRVAPRPNAVMRAEAPLDEGTFLKTYLEMTQGPGVFQVGVPAMETFPAKLFARISANAIRAEASAPPLYPDPRGEIELRREIAGHLAVARGINCSVSQVIVTGGFSAGLGLALRALGLERRSAWIENPGFPWARKGLELARLSIVPIPVDGEGIDVNYGVRNYPDAGLVLVTPGQQAPLGVTLSLERRLRLLEFASERDMWVIEDDYLSDLQLVGRAAPALASLDSDGRVIHVGSFSKTLSPSLRLGFLVVPRGLVSRFAEVAACLAPAPGPAHQRAIAEFMREGHYMRHLRRTKRVYAAKQQALLDRLHSTAAPGQVVASGLTVLLKLPAGTSDVVVAREASAFGLAPASISAWYASPEHAENGLLLGIATTPNRNLGQSCDRLFEVIHRCAGSRPS